jgi:hypothetical protein
MQFIRSKYDKLNQGKLSLNIVKKCGIIAAKAGEAEALCVQPFGISSQPILEESSGG